MRPNLYLSSGFKLICAVLLALFSPCSGIFAQARDSALFKDDFDRKALGNFWQAHDSWSILIGSAYNFIDGTGGFLRTTESFSQNSYIIETSAKGFTDNYYREFRITFGQADPSSQQLYQVRYTAYGGGRLTLSKSTDNIYAAQVLDEVAIFPGLNSSQWYTFKIAKYESGLIQVYLDEGAGYSSVPLLEAIDTTYPALGHTGWQVDTQTFAQDFYVDWISASKPGVEKPAIKEKPVEDSLITQVSAKSDKPYAVVKLVPGIKQFTDRDLTITSVPDYLIGASFIQTANDDKFNATDSFLTFFVKTAAIVYIGYDPRSIIKPAWLNQWTKMSDHIGTSDEKIGHMDLYSKSVEYGEVYPYPIVLGGNISLPALGAKSNYFVAAVKRPNLQSLQAEDAFLSGAGVSKNHLNYNGTGFADFKHQSGDYVEWTVQIDVPGTYDLGFRFANGSFDNRLLKITDNKSNRGLLDFSTTFSWDSWAFLSGPELYLSPGIHKIRVTSIGYNGPNIDELSLFFISPNLNPPIDLSRNSLVHNQISAPLPTGYYKAYPNPFLQGTKIYYGLKEKANVSLSIYTLQGQKLKTIESGLREAGNYQATFNADKLAKGVYIFRLQIGDEVSTGKLIKE